MYLLSLAKELSLLGHEVLTLLSTHPQMDELEQLFQAQNLTVARWNHTNAYHRRLRVLSTLTDFRSVRRITAHFQSYKPDIIHINQQNVEDGLDLLQAAHRCRIPTVSTVHVPHSMQTLGAIGGRFRDWLSRKVFSRTKMPLIAISAVSSRTLCCVLGRADDSKDGEANFSDLELPKLGIGSPGIAKLRVSSMDGGVYCIANGVEQPNLGDRQSLREQWCIPDDALVLGVIGRIESQKNPLFLPRLLALLPDNVHVVWVGDGRLRAELQQEIDRMQLNDRFHLDGWRQDAPCRLAGFDIFVLPSLYEGLPLAILEAMAAGLPCVVSDVDGTRDAIDHSANGFLCRVNDLEHWQTTLQPLLNSAELRRQIGQAAYHTYQAKFSLASMAANTAAVYQDVIERMARA